MARFTELKRFDFPALEQDVLDWWQRHQVFEQSISRREDAPTFTFYEGPPTANGRPGIHHVMARTIKDAFCRYKTMKGFRVERKAGWDTHGLPVEIEVEKALGLEGRHQVDAFGIDKYNAACRESVLKYTDLWNELTTRMGYWVDLDNPYVTFENEYIETVWWLLKQIYDKGLLYQGYKIQWYSPGSGTVLSSHEVSLGYKEVQDPSVYIRFAVEDEPDTYFLAWTTTPWTLISNTALAVGPKVGYVKVRGTFEGSATDGPETIYLAKSLIGKLGQEVEIIDEMKGADLLGKTYTPLFSYFTDEVDKGEAWRVVPADFVSTEDGTGIVHMAPCFGAEDYAVGQAEGLPLFNPVAPDGTFTDKAELVSGMWFKEADKVINRNLRERGLLFKHQTYLHNYPHDWRKGTPLMSYPVESWFIRTTAVKDRLLELNSQINWQPSNIGTGRFGEWLKNNVDWALSRRRYWGTPLPIWVSDANPEYVEVIGSIAELRDKAGDQFPADDADLDLHRPFVDTLTWPAPPEIGGTMRRVEDLIDVWFDSGAMPFAQWHYPFENKEQFERNFPGDFIAEGVDQTRGWFYTLHAIATLVMDNYAYKNVVVNGLVLDEKGDKMSKSKGNAVDPFTTIAKYGADVVRWYMMSNTPPWENIKFAERGLTDTLRKFFSTLSNVYSFFATYANIDGFTYAEDALPLAERSELDRWILSRLGTTIAETDAALADYNPTKAARAVEGFVEELSNWYIRRSRRRFWAAGRMGDDADTTDKLAAYQTVHECLDAVARLMAPIAPFFSEWLYQRLGEATGRTDALSVHLADFPTVDDAALDADLERRMGLARTISSVVLGLRNESKQNVRQPLGRIMVVTDQNVSADDVRLVEGIILSEVNVKGIEFVEGSSSVVQRSAKPNFKRLGKRLGRLMKGVNQQVRGLNSDEIDRYLDVGMLILDVDGEQVVLEGDDLEIVSEGIDGWLVGQENSVTVALDTALTDALIAEGLAREVVNRIQNLRKSADFDVTDRIAVQYAASDALALPLADALAIHAASVQTETLADALEAAAAPEGEAVETFKFGKEHIFSKEHITLGLRRTG
ncbi:MAG: isoleucine--tRNA ligase [Bacteroidota bacterium]